VGSSDGIRCDNRSRNLKQFFFPLAYVKEEVKTLAKRFSGGLVRTLLDREAGERQFKGENLSSFGIIHIAAHGVIDDANWWRSALLLQPDGAHEEDGFLTALEISELKLGARLVVLSACGTGTGSLFGGEGIRGLSGAFMRAGAEFVLVSLWNVDDKATAVFMGDFYRFLAGGDSPARALARTKLQMIGSGFRNPFYWAPFVLIGRADDAGREGAGREREVGLLDDERPRAGGQ
jgi:CHAT domain-containing protein